MIEDSGSRPHYVYRIYNWSNVLLYVGVTSDVKRRLYQQQRDKEWWPEVGSHTSVEYPGRPAALAAEKAAIQAEDPKYNLDMSLTRKRRNPAGQPHVLYRCYHRSGRLLYVGITLDFLKTIDCALRHVEMVGRGREDHSYALPDPRASAWSGAARDLSRQASTQQAL